MSFPALFLFILISQPCQKRKKKKKFPPIEELKQRDTLRVAQFAHMVNVSNQRIYSMVKKGEIKTTPKLFEKIILIPISEYYRFSGLENPNDKGGNE
mgnify:CR=1 FL=1